MSDFTPPTGPPPPKVPEGWKVQWNDQYSEWFYVNIYTKKSQWDKPTEPVYPPNDEAPSGAPPGYAPNGGSSVGGVGLTNTTQGQTDQKNNPYDPKPSTGETDEELARRLQAEEDARSQGTRSAQQDYMNTPMGYQNSGSSPYPPQQQGGQYPQQPDYAQQGQQSYPEQLPPREQKKSGGFLGKLLAKASSSGKPHGGYGQQQGGYGQQQYPQQYGGGGYGQQGMMGGGYGQQQGMMGGRGYGQPMMGGGGYGRPQKKPGGGMGMAGGAALGLGGGLIGGAMLANAFDDDNDDYREGYQDGQQDNDDYGGGDDGGGGDE